MLLSPYTQAFGQVKQIPFLNDLVEGLQIAQSLK